ncbi:MAG TPA: YiiX/YebB-like N1pC/P60 family cysteine hydrolase, partial [Planctomycetaceae bacterium]|nr:YiiX/YebB-like N1pC/P60 family cysteine hydrolase [Planctomycetaceae bacterium]
APAMSASQAAELLSRDLPTGSLIFSQGDCLAVKVFTASRYTHVGAIVEREGRHQVYESTGGAGVRKQNLEEFLASQGGASACVYRPQNKFTEEQQARFERHLDSELGRPYAIAHHLTGRRCEGLHCAEYATDALVAANVLTAEHPPRVSPASLKTGIERSELYREVATLQLEPVAPRQPEDAGWCSRMWFDTKLCTRNCYRKLRGWFCCK